jgi:tetratricopeptide (TPR) repeat protein
MPAIHEILKTAIEYQQRGYYQEAENLYGQIISADPQNVAAWHLLGRLAWQTNNREAALRYLRKAIALKPDYAECHSD